MSLYEEQKPGDLLKWATAKRQQRAAEEAQKYFREFFRQAWHVVEPARALIGSWHIDCICDHLQAVSNGQIKRLLLTVPPGFCKSISVSVMWPAWQWIQNPKWRSIATSYSEALATRDSVRCRALLESNWYQSSFKPKWGWSSDQNIKTWFENTEKGSRISLGVGGSATGIRADCIAVDDPLNAKDQFSTSVLENCIFWWDQVMSSRLNDMSTGVKIIIMQRLSSMDLAAHVLETGGYQHVNLMSEFEPERRTKTFIMVGGKEHPFWEDPRKEAGELLFPAMFTREVIEQAKKDLGSFGFASQHQQSPSPAEGGILKRHWWRYWSREADKWGPVRVRKPEGDWTSMQAVDLKGAGREFPEMDEMALSWDLSFKDLKGSDFVVGQVWGRRGANKFLLHQVKARMGITETVAAIRRMSIEYPKAVLKLVEDKANGPAVIDMLKNDIPGLVAVNPEGGKIARANAGAPQIESGNVFLPHPLSVPWVNDYIEASAAFPNGRYDDEIDATSQMLFRWGMGGHFGVIEYLKSESAREESMKHKKEAVATGDQTVRCPECHSMAVTMMAPGQGKRCGNCGNQFDRPAGLYSPPKRGQELQKSR